MFLNYMQMVNYKNLKSAKFSFAEGVNTIIGENDAGKSNAMTAIRILLDDTYYYNTKRLKENDFSYALGNWKGHWIILSAIFGKVTAEDKKTEVCAGIVPEKENEDFLKSYIKCGNDNIGVVTLFIRPQRALRKKLSEIRDLNEFTMERNKIKLSDYEFYFTSRSQTNFLDGSVYDTIVGDLESGKCSNPDDDDNAILGNKLNIADVQDHISVVFIDALRDVQSELNKPRNPIRRIVESIESLIKESEIDDIQDEIIKLNSTISSVEQVELIGRKINKKLLDMIGMVYSPEIILESGLKDDINSLSRYLFMKSSKQNDIESLGLGHLNMIYMALKIVEYEFNRTRELINIMIIEEPEAHIHTHIQKTLFEKLKVTKDYTQIIATTHSTHLSEVSDIKNINIMKTINDVSYAMQPSVGLDTFGEKMLGLSKINLSSCIERYLDAKRTVLLFSKGIILVEGDGEEILIPNMVKAAFGLTLDELGIGLINVGSTAFEYIACLFGQERINRYCAIVTDEDIQAVKEDSSFYSIVAEERGQSRKEKLDKLFGANTWIRSFYATHTLEIDFVDINENRDFVEKIIELNYTQKATIDKHKEAIKGTSSDRANAVLTLARDLGKGWYSTILSEKLTSSVVIPDYILDAIAFSSREVITTEIILKMMEYSLGEYEREDGDEIDALLNLLHKAKKIAEKREIIDEFRKNHAEDIVAKFLNKLEQHR